VFGFASAASRVSTIGNKEGIVFSKTWICALTALFGLICSAQQRTGSMAGTVSDSSGLAVQNATVRVENLATGMAREIATGPEGQYSFPLLPVGAYRVTAAKSGFAAASREPLAVGVNQQLRLDLRLEVAGSQQELTVLAEAPQVNTADATVGSLVAHRQLVDLPLNGRNFTQLGTLIPGAVPTPQRLGGDGTNSGFAVNGQRTQSNNFLLDGVSNNDTLNSGYVMTPPPDALEQFKMVTHNFSAEYGANSGSVVTAITKAGTNNLHGALWDFLRNDKLDARNFFAPVRPALRQNQFGGSAGGPLGRDKTFLSGYYEGVRAAEGLVNNVVVLTQRERSGDFTASPMKPKDPLTGRPFDGDMIPASCMDPVAQSLLSELVPLPNTGATRYVASPEKTTGSSQFGVRLDHSLSQRNSLFGRYAHGASDVFNPLGPSTFSPGGASSKGSNHAAVISDTHVFSPTLLNEVSVAFLRQYANPVTRSGVAPSDYGFRFDPTEGSAVGTPFFTLSGLFTGGDAGQAFTKIARNTYKVNDNVSWVKGRHTVKAGWDFQRSQVFLVFPNRPNGDFTFNGNYSGVVAADFLLGRAVQFRQGGGDPSKHFFGTTNAFYAQDDFRMTRRLTFNAGLRYEVGSPYHDKYGRMASWQVGKKSAVRPDAPENLLYPGDAGVPEATIATDRTNFAPRVGIAYDLTGDGLTSVRAGYGVYFDTIPGVAAFQNINVPPFNRFVQVDGVPSFADPYAGFATNPQTDPSRAFPCPCLVIGFSPDVRSPYSQHWHASLQRQLGRDWMAELAYTGTAGTKFPGYLEVNPAVPGPGATVGNTQQRRLYKEFNLVRPTFGQFNSNYHALQMQAQKRYGKGLALTLSYAFSKAIDFQSSVNLGDPRPQDAISMSDIRGLAIFDTRHRVAGGYVWELPWKFSNGWARAVAGGWSLQGILAAQSGNPLTATEAVDRSLRGLAADRPDQVKNPNNGPKTPQQWFDTGAFVRLPALAGGQRSGTAGRNTIIGPGMLQVDLAASKRLAVLESHTLEIRGEMFNAPNHTNFQNPLTNISTPQTFGAVQQARPARIVQLALKYVF
jgi:hypothetical protein